MNLRVPFLFQIQLMKRLVFLPLTDLIGLNYAYKNFNMQNCLKTKVDLGEIAQAETDIINLKQKAKDLRVQLSEQLEKNDGFVGDSSNQLHQTSTKLYALDYFYFFFYHCIFLC